MKRTAIRCSSILVTLCAALLSACADGPIDEDGLDQQTPPPWDAALPEVELDAIAIERLARRADLDLSEIRLVGTASVRHAALGRAIREIKVENLRDGTIEGVAVDERGEEVDAGALLREEEAARAAIERRADGPLAAWLAEAAADDSIEVTLWLKSSPPDLPERPEADEIVSRSEIDRFNKEVERRLAARARAAVQPVRARLERLGFSVTANEQVPVLRATLPARVVEQLRGWEEIDRMYLPTVMEPMLVSESNAIFANWVHSRGFNGNGVPVAVIEVGGQINVANPFLAGVTQDLNGSCLHPHAAAVAGIIRSTHTTELGIAHAANLWIGGACGGSSTDLQDRATAATTWGARALNLSFGLNVGGELKAQDRFYDELVINHARTVVVAAGNDGNSAHVASPATAFNVITVGSFDEATTTMSSTSSAVDPASGHSDREKPEVAAPGVEVVSAVNAHPWIANTGSGTSYAAPMVTGTVALMMDRHNTLWSWPEIVRSIVMASATRNIEGASRLSELDGAGGIYSDYADDIVSGARGRWSGTLYDCGAASATQLTTLSLVAGAPARVVISWPTDPSYGSYTTQPSADLDLVIKDPSGALIASSASWDNTYEIVEFTPAVGGNYTVQVNKYRCDVSPRRVGWASFQ